MKSSEYWEKRIANSTWKTYNNLEEKNRTLLEMYQEASLSISDELYRVAEKVKTSTPTLSDMHKYNRLIGLQKNIENIIRDLGDNVESFGKTNMIEGFKETYSNIMINMGLTQFDFVPKKVMEEMLRKPWLGSNFSERLWKNNQVLVSNLNDILTNGIIQGKTITEMAIQLNNRMNEGFNVSHRLVRTETMHYLNESTKKAYKDSGCQKVQLWAATDERTCHVCGMKHGNIYELRSCPTLPLHSNCRCTILPVIDEKSAKKDYDNAKEDINNEFNKRNNLDNGFNNKNRKLNISKASLKHSNEGDFTNPRNPKKVKPGEIKLKSGGHGEDNIKLLDKRQIEYNILKKYSNGVRCGNVPKHSDKKKRNDINQSWFPKEWKAKDIEKAGIYVVNLKDKSKYIIEKFEFNGITTAIYKYANYNDVTVVVCYNCNERKIKTIFPDNIQRLVEVKKND
ncbi:minor capsid protein [Clostridium chauvoei]|uniref:Minor capsid protein n=3 Tax=Clostridium chauvoei TaxID=46867 RepID=A0ABD4RHB2_9CLOT|nr:minor capsid protein [Clostridium chauvoei]MBX7280754.1 minor capsid protein [Clostridium chauvoei]MBX7283237.1 minor capsid protein [Clostridium chauvoei]MBX7285878.1 minor capsid protein [Clostridium chauvoei]MBX7288272.1 minor capsid protein [Clostridium chauvoei]MBX7290839.1 minor capsid protein [Clostridium chauvoei]